MKLECPNCRKGSVSTREGIENLPSAYHVMELLDFLKETRPQQENVCSKHQDQTLNFFCTECVIPVCRDCTVVDHKTGEHHNIVDASDMLNEQLQLFDMIKKESKETFLNLNDRSKILEKASKYLSSLEARLNNEVSEQFTEYFHVLKRREEELKEMIHKELHEQRNKIKSTQAAVEEHYKQFTKYYNDFKRSRDSKNIMELLSMNVRMDFQESSVRMFVDETGEEKYKSCVVTFEHKDLLDSLKKIGKVSTKTDPDLIKQVRMK